MQITQYSDAYRDQIISLILHIQTEEFGLSITRNDQPDLADVENFYIKSGGCFWVALVDRVVVGSIALLNIGSGCFALRKMFVKAEFRGKQFGIADLLLKHAEAWAKGNGAHFIYLGTTERFLAAHRFYRKNDYTETLKSDLPSAFPVMAVDKLFFQKKL